MLVLLAGCSAAEFRDFKRSAASFFDSATDPAPAAKTTGAARPSGAKTATAKSTSRTASIREQGVATPRSDGNGEQTLTNSVTGTALVTPTVGYSPTRTLSPNSPVIGPAQKTDPSKLVGLDESEVVRLLGQPEKVHSKPPGTVWSYSASECSLDVFFYLDIASERFRVLAYEVNSSRVTQDMKKVCLGRIQSAFRTE